MGERRSDLRRRQDRERVQVVRAAGTLARYGRRVLIGYLILLSAAVAGIYVLQEKTNHLASELRDSNLASCHRLNLLRAGDNQSHYADWQFFTLTARLVAESKQDVRARKASIAFAGQLNGYASSLTWIPLTPSCKEAVAQARGFHAPVPVSFNTMLPPANALRVGPGE